MANYNWPINPTTINAGPLRYTEDGAPVVVNIDTATPANSTPLPVRQYDAGGNVVAFSQDYGASAQALRTAAQIGNDTGEANFDAGATGAQTLRVEANQGAANATPWNIAAAALPLPTGASTEAKQDDEIAELVTLNAVDFATETTLADAAADLALLEGKDFATETTLAAMSGKLPATLGQKASAASLGVVLASDQPVIPVSPSGGASGSSPGTATVSTAATITAPANALGFILMNLDTSTTNMRYRIGATAAVASGQQLQPGRDTGYIPCGANISIIAESGTCNYDIQWVVR